MVGEVSMLPTEARAMTAASVVIRIQCHMSMTATVLVVTRGSCLGLCLTTTGEKRSRHSQTMTIVAVEQGRVAGVILSLCLLIIVIVRNGKFNTPVEAPRTCLRRK